MNIGYYFKNIFFMDNFIHKENHKTKVIIKGTILQRKVKLKLIKSIK